jgi:hypothetical protein
MKGNATQSPNRSAGETCTTGKRASPEAKSLLIFMYKCHPVEIQTIV